MANTQVMLDYVNQLKRHTIGRTAVLVRLSALEKAFHESHYRQQMAMHLKQLASNNEGQYFMLPNFDGLVIVKNAKTDVIDTALNNVRHAVKDAALVRSLDPIQGVTDAFTVWYNLETHYPDLLDAITRILNDKPVEIHIPNQANNTPVKPTVIQTETITKVKKPRGRLVPMPVIDMPEEEKPLDPESLLVLQRAIANADLEGLVKRQKIMAILPGQDPVPVMQQHFVSFDDVVKTYIPNIECTPDPYLSAYIAQQIDTRVMFNKPDISSQGVILSSVRLSLSSIISQGFDGFDAVNAHQRKNIVIELDILAGMQNPALLNHALELLSDKGYKTCLGGIKPKAFHWLNIDRIPVDFYKIHCPMPNAEYLDDATFINQTKATLSKLELGKVILSGCDSEKVMKFGHTCGFTLMQGNLISPAE